MYNYQGNEGVCKHGIKKAKCNPKEHRTDRAIKKQSGKRQVKTQIHHYTESKIITISN